MRLRHFVGDGDQQGDVVDPDDAALFALGERRFPSLEALHAWFTAQIAGTQSKGEQYDLELARRIGVARHMERAAAAANAPMPTPPPPSKPPPELPAEATDDERAAAMYGPSLKTLTKGASASALIERVAPAPGTFTSMDKLERYFGRAIKAAADDSEMVRELERERDEAIAAFVSDDALARRMYGLPAIGTVFTATRPKPPAENVDKPEEAEVKKDPAATDSKKSEP